MKYPLEPHLTTLVRTLSAKNVACDCAFFRLGLAKKAPKRGTHLSWSRDTPKVPRLFYSLRATANLTTMSVAAHAFEAEVDEVSKSWAGHKIKVRYIRTIAGYLFLFKSKEDTSSPTEVVSIEHCTCAVYWYTIKGVYTEGVNLIARGGINLKLVPHSADHLHRLRGVFARCPPSPSTVSGKSISPLSFIRFSHSNSAGRQP
jgi:hypothetical protein